MIKLKNILKEFTDQNFQMRKEENPGKVGSLLSKVGFRGIAPDKKAYSRLKSFEGGKMFVHIAHHKGYIDNYGDLKGFTKGDTDIGLHRTEYWLRSDKVDVTYLSVTVNGKDVGGVYVHTDVFLKMLKKANSEGFND